MSDRYGPQTVQIEALLERVRNLTDEEAQALAAAWGSAWVAGWVAARAAAWDARDSQAAARAAGWYVALDAAGEAAWHARDARYAVRDAALAVAVRDLIGQHGFTQAHYDTLVRPWESVMGTDWTREAN